jgi:hypothetical protein
VSDYFKKENKIFLDQWMMNNKPDRSEDVLKKMNTEYVGYEFSDDNHLRNAFKRMWQNQSSNQTTGKKSTLITGKPQ